MEKTNLRSTRYNLYEKKLDLKHQYEDVNSGEDYNKDLMTGRKGNSNSCFPEVEGK